MRMKKGEGDDEDAEEEDEEGDDDGWTVSLQKGEVAGLLEIAERHSASL